MKKAKLTQRMWAKVTAFIFVIVFLAVSVLSAIGIGLMLQSGIYLTDKSEMKDELFFQSYSIISGELVDTYIYGTQADVDNYCWEHLISYVSVKHVETGDTMIEYGEVRENDRFDTEYFSYDLNGDGYHSLSERIEVKAQYDFSNEALARTNILSFELKLIDMAYTLRYAIFLIFFTSLILTVINFIFLMCSAGRRVNYDGVRAGWGTKVPFDLMLAVLSLGVFFVLQMCFEWYCGEVWQAITLAVVLIATVSAFVGVCMSFAVRIKLGGWWRNTVVHYIIRSVVRAFRLMGRVVMKLPLIWKSALVIAILTAVEFFLLIYNLYEGDNIVLLWFFEKLFLVPSAIYLALCLKKLYDGAKAISEGHSEYQVDTKYMIGELSLHGRHLNRIGEGISIAVEQRMKSERMKTELITNVSHDIKTPLTSIINYSDLITREQTDNENIREYSVVLLRQSERLKRLIDDLVEASKAQTGNLEIVSSQFDLGVFFAQSAGEYQQRFQECGLVPIIKTPDEPVVIMADGRRMWRIFDNLMNNICKYAQKGTRAYMSLECHNEAALIVFKNTSRDQLDISPDELMERFTRGDSSRNTEGNGLGLAIAKSLVELQGGEMDISVDGDLFKVTLRFPLA